MYMNKLFLKILYINKQHLNYTHTDMFIYFIA